MFHREEGNGKGFLMGLLFGGIIGGIAGLLFAPKAGKKMRNELCDCCKDAACKTKDVVENVCERAEDLIEKAKEIADEAKDIASSFSKGRKR